VGAARVGGELIDDCSRPWPMIAMVNAPFSGRDRQWRMHLACQRT
jgi:hypothetical protein